MIITNGIMKYQASQGETVGEDGRPTEAALEWSEPVACLIQTASDDRTARYDGGEFRKVSATVLTETAIPTDARRVRLERYGENLGEHDVVSIEPLPVVGAFKLFVQ